MTCGAYIIQHKQSGKTYVGGSTHLERRWVKHRRLLKYNKHHNMNLQRVDRMTMAHGLEGRVPFLDLKLIDLVLSVDPALKIYGPERPEKWLLRQAFTGMLPENILWRLKEQFDEGSGVAALMPRMAAGRVDLAEEQAKAADAGLPPLRDPEEAWYFRLFRERYDPARVKQTLGRWVPPVKPV